MKTKPFPTIANLAWLALCLLLGAGQSFAQRAGNFTPEWIQS